MMIFGSIRKQTYLPPRRPALRAAPIILDKGLCFIEETVYLPLGSVARRAEASDSGGLLLEIAALYVGPMGAAS